jgi:hypothetical protein
MKCLGLAVLLALFAIAWLVDEQKLWSVPYWSVPYYSIPKDVVNAYKEAKRDRKGFLISLPPTPPGMRVRTGRLP